MWSRRLWLVPIIPLVLVPILVAATLACSQPSGTSSTAPTALASPTVGKTEGVCQVSGSKVASAVGWSSARPIGRTSADATHPASCTYGDAGKNVLSIITWIGPDAANKPTYGSLPYRLSPQTYMPYVEKASDPRAGDILYYGASQNDLYGVVLTRNGTTVEIKAPHELLSKGTLLTLALEAEDCLSHCN